MNIYGTKTRTVVFDIDGVVACAPAREGRDREAQVVNNVTSRFGEEFVKAHSIEIQGYLHLLYPGIVEFMRWLFRRDVKIHFYSTGARIRNEELVPKIVGMALDGETGRSASDALKDIRIVSREDIAEQKRRNEWIGIPESTVYGGNYHKMLCPGIVDFRGLPNTLLIDDDASYMAFGEEYNFVGGKYYEFFFEGNADRNSPCTDSQFIELCRVFMFAGVVRKIFDIVDETPSLSVVDASEIVQYGRGPERYYPEDHTYFANIYNDFSFYETGLETLKTVNPCIEFPLPVPDSFRNKPDHPARRASDAERFELRRRLDEDAAEFVKRAACLRMTDQS